MGQSLSNPVIEKKTEAGENDKLVYAVTAMQGWRPHMEDMHFVSLKFDENHPDWSFFAIFDGHAGQEASKYSSAHILHHVTEYFQKYSLMPKKISDDNPEFTGLTSDLPSDIYNLTVALHDGFIRLDEVMREDPNIGDDPISCGTTALALIITPSYYIFANCGDSRAILSSDGQLLFQTKDHKPSDATEKARIISAGAHVSIDRVNGNLAVSRALGDFSFKTNTSLPLVAQAVSPEPTMTVIPRNSTDEFAVLACDGIWDVISSQDLLNMVLNRLKITRDVSTISSTIIDAALYLDSRDNMTFLIVMFPANLPELDADQIDQDTELDQLITNMLQSIMNSDDRLNGSSAIIKKINHELTPESRFVLNYKIPFILNLMDEMCPDRDRSNDFPSPFGYRGQMNNFQIIQNALSGFGLISDPQNDDN